MAKKGNSTRWTTDPHPSRLLAELRALYPQLERRGVSWYSVAHKHRLNVVTVQRLLACTGVQRPNEGKTLAPIEALINGLGYRLMLVPASPSLITAIQALIDTHNQELTHGDPPDG